MAESASQEADPRHRTQQSPLASQRAKEQGKEQPRSAWFPMSAKDGFVQWWTNLSPAAAEHKVLSFVPYLQQPPTQTQTGKRCHSDHSTDNASDHEADDLTKSTSNTTEPDRSDPYGPRRWHSSLVKLPGKDRALNEFSVERVGEEVENDLVLLHGYGAGLGFFYKNFEPLSRMPGWRLYALDLLGMGRSSRPHFRIHAKGRQGKITETEQWFVESLEEWRKERKIDRMTLLGHSLGGYMAVCYALKYPGHIKKLILASPVGVPEDPYAVASELPDPNHSTLPEEFSQDQSHSANPSTTTTEPPKDPPRRRQLPKWLTYLWDANFSPFSFVRWSGPFGPRLVSGWTSRRFSQMPTEEAQALHDYAYSLFRQKGSGEYALAYVLAPGAFARSPLIRRIGDVGRGVIRDEPASSEGVGSAASSTARTSTDAKADGATETINQGVVRERGIPVVFFYGENDWMDVAGGFAAAEKLKEAKEKAVSGLSRDERRRDEGSAKVLVVRNAGHHVYLDGWQEFNELMVKEMKDVEVKEERKRRKSWIGRGSFSSA